MPTLPPQSESSVLASTYHGHGISMSWGSAVIAGSIFIFALVGLSCIWTPFWRKRRHSLAGILSFRRTSPPLVSKENSPVQEVPSSGLPLNHLRLTRSESRLSERTLVQGVVYGLDEMCEDELTAHERRSRGAPALSSLPCPEPAYLPGSSQQRQTTVYQSLPEPPSVLSR